jgi:hypothetical protein
MRTATPYRASSIAMTNPTGPAPAMKNIWLHMFTQLAVCLIVRHVKNHQTKIPKCIEDADIAYISLDQERCRPGSFSWVWRA